MAKTNVSYRKKCEEHEESGHDVQLRRLHLGKCIDGRFFQIRLLRQPVKSDDEALKFYGEILSFKVHHDHMLR